MAIGLIWGEECGKSVPLATQGHTKVIEVVQQATLSPLGTCCTPTRSTTVHRASMLNEQRSVGHHIIQEVCTLHNSSIMMAVREDQYIL